MCVHVSTSAKKQQKKLYRFATKNEDFSLERENYSPGRALGEHSAKTHKYSTQ